jgi:hypothetical protein
LQRSEIPIQCRGKAPNELEFLFDRKQLQLKKKVMHNIKEKLELLKLKHANELTALKTRLTLENRFHAFSPTVYYSSNTERPRISFLAQSLYNANEILKTAPPIKDTTEVPFAGKDKTVIESPFRLDIDNPTAHATPMIKLSYLSIHGDVEIKFEPKFIPEFCKPFQRNLTDNQYIHFPGYSLRELKRIRITAFDWCNPNKPIYNQIISWFGGNRTLTDLETIQEIIAKIMQS